jgi:hypothetical protein
MELLLLRLVIVCLESELALQKAFEGTMTALQHSYPNVRCIEPNGNRCVGFQFDEGFEEAVQRSIEKLFEGIDC